MKWFALGLATLGLSLGVTGQVQAEHLFTTFDPPGSTRTNVGGSGINASGQIVGNYFDAGGIQHGYLLSGGSYTTLDPPDATSTIVRGINNFGQIVGEYNFPEGTFHGFLLSGGSYTTLDVPESTLTVAFGINDSGVLVGSHTDVGGVRHGLLATPAQAVPEPGTLTLLGLGALGLIGYAWRRKRLAR